jgi:CRP-like cAMP-binding protein
MNRTWHTLPPLAPRSFLARLRADSALALINSGREVHYERDVLLVKQGGEDRYVLVLLRGEVSVFREHEDGRSTLLDIRHQGDVVGEMEPLDDLARTASVRTMSPVAASLVDSQRFMNLLHTHPDITLQLLRNTSARLRVMNSRLDVRRSVRQRLGQLLLDLVESQGQLSADGAVTVKLTQAQLAEMIGASDAAVEKALTSFKMADVVATGYRRIILLDVERLRHEVTGVESAQAQ